VVSNFDALPRRFDNRRVLAEDLVISYL